MKENGFIRIGKAQGGIFQYRRVLNGKKDSTKLWACDSRDPVTGKRRRAMGFESRGAAIAHREEQEKKRGTIPTTPENLTFTSAVKMYVDAKLAAGKRATSYDHLALWVGIFGQRKLDTIGAVEVEAQLTRLMESRSWSPATRNRCKAELSGLFSWCYRREWIDRHPMDRGRVASLPENNSRTRWLRAAEVDALVLAAPDWMKPMIAVAVATAMRQGELVGLTRSCYQEDDQGNAYLVVEKTKNGSRLTVPLMGWVATWMKARVASLQFPGDLIFVGPRGRGALMAIKRDFPVVVEKAGLAYGRTGEGATWHSLRHTGASLALNAGIPEDVVQKMGNWKTRAMVMRYAHHSEERLREAASTLTNLVKIGSNIVAVGKIEDATSAPTTDTGTSAR